MPGNAKAGDSGSNNRNGTFASATRAKVTAQAGKRPSVS